MDGQTDRHTLWLFKVDSWAFELTSSPGGRLVVVVGTRSVRINTKPALVKGIYVKDFTIHLPSVLKSKISNHLLHLVE